MKSAVVIIPTIGSNTLITAINSIAEQTYENVTAMIVVDGKQYASKVRKMLLGKGFDIPIRVNYLEDNVGANGFYGQRVYAAFSHLVNEDYLFFLDEDNWLEPSHIETMISKLESTNSDWVYSLRNIWSKDKQYICRDDCESLGKWQAWTKTNMVDTNCYCIPREIATKIASLWHSGWGEDRVVFYALHNNFNNYTCTGKYTVNYRLGGNEGSVTKEFFEQGNKVMNEFYNGEYPWTK